MNNNDRDVDINLPYVEKFRPKKLDDVLSHANTIDTLKHCKKSGRIPHLLFYGPPGTGKTSTIEAFLHEVYGDQYFDMVMNINASEERGIDVVRNKITNFVSNKPINNGGADTPAFKFVILDEADAITTEAQAMLRIVIERNTKYARFCLICNCIKKINQAIQSRCKIFKFPPLDDPNVFTKIDDICIKNNKTITDPAKKLLWKLSKGDMREVLHLLQIMSIICNDIDSDTILNFVKYPTSKRIEKIYDCFFDKSQNLESSINIIQKYMKKYSYSLKDIITELSDRVNQDLQNNTLNTKQVIYIYTKLRDIEMNIITASETSQQIASVAAAFTICSNM